MPGGEAAVGRISRTTSRTLSRGASVPRRLGSAIPDPPCPGNGWPPNIPSLEWNRGGAGPHRPGIAVGRPGARTQPFAGPRPRVRRRRVAGSSPRRHRRTLRSGGIRAANLRPGFPDPGARPRPLGGTGPIGRLQGRGPESRTGAAPGVRKEPSTPRWLPARLRRTAGSPLPAEGWLRGERAPLSPTGARPGSRRTAAEAASWTPRRRSGGSRYGPRVRRSRATTSRWISFVPSKISLIRASR